jgi:uncharacterized protein YndB with AHSA1/START domain
MITEQELVDDAVDLGTVVVTVEVSAPIEKVWESLTDPDVAARWFGALDAPLAAGGSARLDFGDGDFFELDSVKLNFPNVIQYDWRFLGIGPCNSITWRIVAKDAGCLVMVSDSQPGRPAEAAAMLREGWLDFTSRLVGYHATGKNTRYDWRRELDVGTEINASAKDVWDRLFAPEVQTQWLPFDATIESGRQVTVCDEPEPKQVWLENVVWQPGQQVEFQVGNKAWKQSTACRIELTARETDTLFYVSHNGWYHIDQDQSEQLNQRRRFCELWIEAVKRARQIAETN